MQTVNFKFSDELFAVVGLHRKQVFVENGSDMQGLRNLLGILYPDLMPYANTLQLTCECVDDSSDSPITVEVSIRPASAAV